MVKPGSERRSYSYYPGCSLHSAAREYDVSSRQVCQALGIELQELKDWICCGASSAHSSDRLLSLALPAQTLKQAEEKGLPLAVPCAMCSFRLKSAAYELRDKDTLEAVNSAVGGGLTNSAVVEPLLKVLGDDSLFLPVKRRLSGLKVACYYGCLLVRPKEVLEFDDEENPQTMDRLMTRLGAETPDWGLKTACCGAGMPIARPDIVSRLSNRIVTQARECGADCIAVACPMCHGNLDIYQKKPGLPVFYFTQLMGIALGLPLDDLMIDKLITDPMPLLQAKGLA